MKCPVVIRVTAKKYTCKLSCNIVKSDRIGLLILLIAQQDGRFVALCAYDFESINFTTLRGNKGSLSELCIIFAALQINCIRSDDFLGLHYLV